MLQVDLEQVKEHLYELIEQAAGGEEVVITKDSEPLARLVAVSKRKRMFGSAKGLIEMAEDFDEPLEDFRESM